jgi:hypothetical protein
MYTTKANKDSLHSSSSALAIAASFSIADSQISDGLADTAWQRVEFATDEFLREYYRLQDSFVAALRGEAPASAEDWIRAHEGVAPRRAAN